jgi:molecular chaperone IbpA
MAEYNSLSVLSPWTSLDVGLLFQNIQKRGKFGLGIWDHISQLDSALERCANNTTSHPPYDLIRVDEETQLIELAVAGYNPDSLGVDVQDKILTITGKSPSEHAEDKYYHRGIARREFTKTFWLSDDTKVQEAKLVNGILSVKLVRVLPEEKKRKTITIQK